VALRTPVDRVRNEQFKKDVDDLKKCGHMRYYTAEINKKTGDNTGNIANYYQGKIPISDNFLKKFRDAYGAALASIRKETVTTPVRNHERSLSAGGTALAGFEQRIMQMLLQLGLRLARIEKKIGDQQQTLNSLLSKQGPAQ